MNGEEEKQVTPAEEPEKAAAEAKPEEENASQWENAEPEDKEEEPATLEPSPLEKAQQELAQIQEKYLYLQAEYQNYRKRSARDIADARGYAVSDTLHPFLTVFDYLKMAEQAALQSDNVEQIRCGLQMIIGEFVKAFDELNVKTEDAVGKPFDPACHEAVASENSDTVPEGTVIRQWNAVFRRGEQVLRAARVVVSKGPAKEEAADGAKQEK